MGVQPVRLDELEWKPGVNASHAYVEAADAAISRYDAKCGHIAGKYYIYNGNESWDFLDELSATCVLMHLIQERVTSKVTP